MFIYKALSAVAAAAFGAAIVLAIPGFSPEVEARTPAPVVKSDRLDIQPARPDLRRAGLALLRRQLPAQRPAEHPAPHRPYRHHGPGCPLNTPQISPVQWPGPKARPFSFRPFAFGAALHPGGGRPARVLSFAGADFCNVRGRYGSTRYCACVRMDGDDCPDARARQRPVRADAAEPARPQDLCRPPRGRRRWRRRRDRAPGRGRRAAEHPGFKQPHTAARRGLSQAPCGGARAHPPRRQSQRARCPALRHPDDRRDPERCRDAQHRARGRRQRPQCHDLLRRHRARAPPPISAMPRSCAS